MGFKQGNPGCPCCECNWTFTITGCNGTVQSGVTVNLRQSGSLIGTGTTNGSGVAVISVPAGTYDVQVVGTGYATNTSSRAHTCGQSTSIILTAATGYVCIPACNVPVPKTLFWTDSEGTHQLDWVSGSDYSCNYNKAGAFNTGCGTTGNMNVAVTLTLTATPSMHIEWHIVPCAPSIPGTCPLGTLYYGTNTSPGNLATADSTGGSLVCSPFSASVAMPTAWVAHAADPGPPAGYCDGGGEQTPGGGGTLSITP
jgi:hypothetical protein